MKPALPNLDVENGVISEVVYKIESERHNELNIMAFVTDGLLKEISFSFDTRLLDVLPLIPPLGVKEVERFGLAKLKK